jgi:hypothetical protein
METQDTASKLRWTAKRLFKTSVVSFFLSLAGIVLAVFLWWPLAFSWDSDSLPIPAYIDIGFGIIGMTVGVLSVVVMLISGFIVLYSHARPSA